MNPNPAAVLLLIALVPLAAQPKFEVASVKRTPPGGSGLTSISPPGEATFTATNVTLQILISMAFGLDSDAVSGKLGWIESEYYDVSAKAEGGARISSEQLKPLLQQLLVERFKLSFHRETKDRPGYALVVAKDAPKLPATKGGASMPTIFRGGLRAGNASLDLFAAMLARPAGRPVINRTGIEGNFDFKLDFAPDGATDSSLPSIFTALQEQMGLKLVPQKVPVEVLIVDHAERVPTENE